MEIVAADHSSITLLSVSRAPEQTAVQIFLPQTCNVCAFTGAGLVSAGQSTEAECGSCDGGQYVRIDREVSTTELFYQFIPSLEIRTDSADVIVPTQDNECICELVEYVVPIAVQVLCNPHASAMLQGRPLPNMMQPWAV